MSIFVYKKLIFKGVTICRYAVSGRYAATKTNLNTKRYYSSILHKGNMYGDDVKI